MPDLALLPSLGLPVVAVNELTDLPMVHVTPVERQGIALAIAHDSRRISRLTRLKSIKHDGQKIHFNTELFR